MPAELPLLLTQAVASLYLTGLIWFVQLVHYPLLAEVGVDRFPRYEAEHRRRTAHAVLAPMLAELLCAAALAVLPGGSLPPWQTWLGAALAAALWALTFLAFVPLHERLTAGFDAAAHRRLVRLNWLRTALWSGRGLLALWMLREFWTKAATG